MRPRLLRRFPHSLVKVVDESVMNERVTELEKRCEDLNASLKKSVEEYNERIKVANAEKYTATECRT